MVLKPKIKKVSPEEMIERGGHVTADFNSKKNKEWVNFCLRIQKDMLEDIDKILENRAGISKTGWILEAIQEKLRFIEE